MDNPKFIVHYTLLDRDADSEEEPKVLFRESKEFEGSYPGWCGAFGFKMNDKKSLITIEVDSGLTDEHLKKLGL